MRLRYLLWIAIVSSIFSFLARTARATSTECDRNMSFARLTPQAQAKIRAGSSVTFRDTNTNTDFHILYAITKLKADATLAMGVISTYGEYGKHMRSINSTKVIKETKNVARVYYDVKVPIMLINNMEFTADVTIDRLGPQNYIQHWDLYSSSGLTKLRSADGYAKISEFEGGSIMVYCAYNVPAIEMFTDMVNDTAYEALQENIEDMRNWVNTAASSPANAKPYLDRIKKMFE